MAPLIAVARTVMAILGERFNAGDSSVLLPYRLAEGGLVTLAEADDMVLLAELARITHCPRS